MNVRLTTTDLERIDVAAQHFATLRPVPVHLGPADVVRIALRELLTRIEENEVGTADHSDGVAERQAA